MPKAKLKPKYDQFAIARAIKATSRVVQLVTRLKVERATKQEFLSAIGQINLGLRAKVEQKRRANS
jgi:hypothetical protein